MLELKIRWINYILRIGYEGMQMREKQAKLKLKTIQIEQAREQFLEAQKLAEAPEILVKDPAKPK